MLLRCLALLVAVGLAAPPAAAATLRVQAGANSVDGGSGFVTFGVAAGGALAVSAVLGGPWQSGPGQTSDADGLPRTPFTFAGFTAPLGSLVGEIGGVYAFLGADFLGQAWNTGTLLLFHWGRSAGGSGTIEFVLGLDSATPGVIPPDATPIPAPGAMWLFALGGLALGALRRR
jgi:hypothetical protein